MYRSNHLIIINMKKISKMVALFFGCTSCLAQVTRCPLQDKADAGNFDDSYQNENALAGAESKSNVSALSFLQDLDKIYYL